MHGYSVAARFCSAVILSIPICSDGAYSPGGQGQAGGDEGYGDNTTSARAEGQKMFEGSRGAGVFQYCGHGQRKH